MIEKFPNYLQAVADLEILLSSISEDQVKFKPSPGKWNVNEIAAHLADVEIQSYVRYRSVLADDIPFLMYHNQDGWNDKLKNSEIPLSESLQLLKTIRLINYKLICSLTEQQLSMEGLHSKRGKVTVQNLIETYTSHVYVHMEQIKRNLKEYEKMNKL